MSLRSNRNDMIIFFILFYIELVLMKVHYKHKFECIEFFFTLILVEKKLKMEKINNLMNNNDIFI